MEDKDPLNDPMGIDNIHKAKSMGKKGERGSQRREWKRASGMVQKSDVCVYLVPNQQGTTERVAPQNRQSSVRQMQVWGGDDRGTRGGRVPRTGAVEAAQGGLEGMEGGPRGTGGK